MHWRKSVGPKMKSRGTPAITAHSYKEIIPRIFLGDQQAYYLQFIIIIGNFINVLHPIL